MLLPSFFTKLCVYFAPFALVFGPPAFVLIASGEIKNVDEIAERHFHGRRDAVYGPAYTNPDARYKLASARLHRPTLIAMGSSRTLGFRSDLFTLREGTFYNVGLLPERLHEMRRALAHIPVAGPPKKSMILVLDQWAFNPSWPDSTDNPLFEREIGASESNALNALQRCMRLVWSDLLKGRLQVGALLDDDGGNIGVNGKLRGNGFRWDGSYHHADVRDAHAKDAEFKESLRRVREGVRRYEFSDDVDPEMVEELRRLLAAAREKQLDVVGILPPYAPTVVSALRASGKHGYMEKLDAVLRPVFTEAGYPFFDYTSCEPLGCTDGEFIDGMHPGVTADARLLLDMVSTGNVDWLDEVVDQSALAQRVAEAAGSPELPPSSETR